MKSFMFVPSKPKMLEKITSSEADACIIDLEDSINEVDKNQALVDACNFWLQNLKKQSLLGSMETIYKMSLKCLAVILLRVI